MIGYYVSTLLLIAVEAFCIGWAFSDLRHARKEHERIKAQYQVTK